MSEAPGLDPWLLERLVCPATRTPLRLDAAAGELVSEAAGLAYPIRDGVPVLVVGEARALPLGRLTIRDYADELAGEFHAINAEWIGAMFRIEETDAHVLAHPREAIVDRGGAILFVEAEGLGIVGTCALQKTGETSFELTKMGVRESARGMKAGGFLLAAAIRRARALGADPLYLLTNARCAAAIHLYEAAGFRHDAGIMAHYGARYARCDVAMRYDPETGSGTRDRT